MLLKFKNIHSPKLLLTTILSIFLITGSVFAVTTIGTNIQIGSGAPDLTLDGDDVYITGTLEVDGDVAAKTGRTATFLVAASDASPQMINQADYVADGTADNVQIQAAIDALPVAGGKIVLSEGTYDITSAIQIPSNASLTGQGFSTVLKLGNGAEADVLINSDTTNGNSNITISNLKIDGNKAQNTGNLYGIRFEEVSYSLITDCYVVDVSGSSEGAGIKLGALTRKTVVQNCIVESNEFRGIWTVGSFRNRIVGNDVRFNTHGIDIDGFTSNTVVQGNLSGQNTKHGIFVEQSSHHITVTGNIVGNNDKQGIVVWRQNAGDDTREIVISGNIITKNGEHGIRTGGNSGASSDILITGNTIVENGQDAAFGDAAGVFIGSTSRRITIVGNDITDPQSSPTQDYGIQLKWNSDNVFATNNKLSGNATGPVEDSTSTGINNVIRQNQGFTTESSGTATISSGSTSVTVSHGLDVAPSAADCSVTPTNSLGDASSSSFWTSSFGSSSFTVNVGVGPGASTATFAWSCAVY